MEGPFTHYTKSSAVVQNIVTTQELWGKQSGPFGIGGMAARAYYGPHDPQRVNQTTWAVEFETQIAPASAYWMGSTAALWRQGTPGTSDDGTYVKVPITTTGVF
jgi:hypothetical protein